MAKTPKPTAGRKRTRGQEDFLRAQDMLKARRETKKGPPPKKPSEAARDRQRARDSAAIRNADLGPSAKERAAAKVVKGSKPGTLNREWTFKFEKTTKSTHVYSREVGPDDSYRTSKHYLSVASYPKPPKKITVTVQVG